jgi:hypothetical protein
VFGKCCGIFTSPKESVHTYREQKKDVERRKGQGNKQRMARIDLSDTELVERILDKECKRLNLKKGYWGALFHLINEIFLYYSSQNVAGNQKYFQHVLGHVLPCNKCRPHYKAKKQAAVEITTKWYCDEVRNPINSEQGKPLIAHQYVDLKYHAFIPAMNNFLCLYLDKENRYWCHATHSERLQVVPHAKHISDYAKLEQKSTTTTTTTQNDDGKNKVVLQDVVWLYPLWQFLFIVMVQSWIEMSKQGALLLSEFVEVICDLVPNTKHAQVMKDFNKMKREKLHEYPPDTKFEGSKLSTWFMEFFRYYLDTLHVSYPIVILQLQEYKYYNYQRCIPCYQSSDGQIVLLDMESKVLKDRIVHSMIQAHHQHQHQHQPPHQQQQRQLSVKHPEGSSTSAATDWWSSYVYFGFKILLVMVILYYLS